MKVNEVKEALRWAQAAYGDPLPDFAKSVPEHLEVTCAETNSRVIVGVSAATNVIYVAIRGTSTTQETLTDLKYDLVPYESASEGALVHKGFLRATNKVRDGVIAAMVGCSSQQRAHVVVTGHSLGGALAKLLGDCIRLHPSVARVDVVSFGSPHVGNLQFSNYLDSVLSITRVTCMSDPVPRLFNTIDGFTHSGNQFELETVDVVIEAKAKPTMKAVAELVVSGMAALYHRVSNADDDVRQHHSTQLRASFTNAQAAFKEFSSWHSLAEYWKELEKFSPDVDTQDYTDAPIPPLSVSSTPKHTPHQQQQQQPPPQHQQPQQPPPQHTHQQQQHHHQQQQQPQQGHQGQGQQQYTTSASSFDSQPPQYSTYQQQHRTPQPYHQPQYPIHHQQQPQPQPQHPVYQQQQYPPPPSTQHPVYQQQPQQHHQYYQPPPSSSGQYSYGSSSSSY